MLTALDTVTEAAGEVTETSTEMVLDVLDGVRDAATANSPALGANANVVLGVLIRGAIVAEDWKSGSNALHDKPCCREHRCGNLASAGSANVGDQLNQRLGRDSRIGEQHIVADQRHTEAPVLVMPMAAESEVRSWSGPQDCDGPAQQQPADSDAGYRV